MLIDLLSTSNFVIFNSKLATIIGLHPAIYIQELMNINDKAIKKNKVSGKYFSIDRDYIKQRTTFDIEEQLELENSLSNIGILEKSDEDANGLTLNLTVLTSILTTSDEKILDDISGIAKKKRKVSKGTKRDCARDELKNHINATNPELKEAYIGWVDGVYANPKGFLSKRAIEIFQRTVDEFSDHDLDIALKLIDIATVNGYRNADWAIERYKEDYQVKYKVPTSNTSTRCRSVSGELF